LIQPITVFIGYDSREAVAYHVCQQSIIENCSEPERLRFVPVTGERRDGSNAFIYQRFLVPYLCGYEGCAVFMDGDMIVRGDIVELWNMRRGYVGVQVVKHEYLTKHPVKYLGNKNDDYPRKNWSSLILWDCGFFPNRILTPDFVGRATGSFLHRFQWLKDEQIGELDPAWNRLVLEQDVQPTDKLLHYTIGAPCFTEYADCDHAEEWWQTYRRATQPLET
jgi:hypothetical protein